MGALTAAPAGASLSIGGANSSCSGHVVPVMFQDITGTDGKRGRRNPTMDDFELDRQSALVLALGWLAALWITLT